MINKSARFSHWDSLWCKQNVIRFSFAWAALSLAIFLFFGTSMQGTGRPDWYRAVTAYPIQNIPVLFSSLLCLRNGTSRRMPSGSKVWLLVGAALFCYFVGNLFFSSWELVWQLNSTGSLGDPFFILFYVLLSSAMLMAITNRRITLNIYQWILVGIAGIYASSLAILIQAPAATTEVVAPPAIVSTVAANDSPGSPLLTAPSDTAAKTAKTEPAAPVISVPDWVAAADKFFKPYGKTLNMFYVWCDVGLFCLATIMLLGCWGGKLSNAWRVNAQAVGCIYVADMWYSYAGNQISNYQSGFFLEVFWILGSLQFGIAAAMEFNEALLRQRSGSLL